MILSLDRRVSVESGAHITRAAVFGLATAEDRLFEPLRDRPATGAFARLLRAVAWDGPVAWWFATLQHEVFGHGGRIREFGGSASYDLHSPWSGGRAVTYINITGATTEEFLRFYTGGSEANGWAATLLEREMVAGRPLRPAELLLLAANRYVTTRYVLQTTPDPATDPGGFYREGGLGDVVNYLENLSILTTGSSGIDETGVSPLVDAQYRRLERQAVWNGLDPGAWLALYHALAYIGHGDTPRPVPLPRFRGRRILPVLSSDWLPDGGVASLTLMVSGRRDGKAEWMSLTLRRGAGTDGRFGAVGAASERIFDAGRFRVGGEAEIWTRPGRGIGGGARLRMLGMEGWYRSLFLDAGVKSSGHWPGRPAGTGPFLSFGLRVPVPAR